MRLSCTTRFFWGGGRQDGGYLRGGLIRNPACIFTKEAAAAAEWVRHKKLWSGGGKKQSPTEELGKVPPSIFISDPNA